MRWPADFFFLQGAGAFGAGASGRRRRKLCGGGNCAIAGMRNAIYMHVQFYMRTPLGYGASHGPSAYQMNVMSYDSCRQPYL